MSVTVAEGQRIRLTEAMQQEPDPIPVGSEGRVTWVNEHPALGFTQVAVHWDSGRTLMLSVPPDKFEVIP